ncbi:MAG: CinA family nicotinamide mononucleotide deamidase-related protein [Proteobacteria bacterium]|nr:CinA family nicotinamide mononucleotide deamidase-related protein [Pseudomonadota bacterium]MBU1686266.1 CinA family nicotinamide mononucleotide deamidase-related protein [Pseudomonadota bacterium]
MIGEIIAIGDELTSGRILNTTSYFAASQLFAAGHEVAAMTTIGDDPVLIGTTLLNSLHRADFVIVTGGLGGTSDDLTTEAVADALDRPSTFYPEILEQIRTHSKNAPEQVRLSLEKLAWLPAGAHALKYDAGMAGYFLVHEGKPIFFLPGIPHEMKQLLVETVLSRLAVWEGEDARLVRQRVYRVAGLSETEINDLIGRGGDDDKRIKIGYYPVFPEVQVSLTVAAGNEPEIDALFAAADGRIRRILGLNIFGGPDETLEGVVGQSLGRCGLSLAVAESCTGGLIAHRITRVAGSSVYFYGGIVAYSNLLKEQLLGVSGTTIAQFGAVSAETARAMAEGVRRVTGADLGLSVTGIAGPTGGSPDKPVGTVCFALATNDGCREYRFLFNGDRNQVQEASCLTGLDLIRRHLAGG